VENIFSKVVETPSLHSRWLNTLSMMENAGAKKIKNCEHPVLVNEIILKHSAEEARHAHYLKKQIRKIEKDSCPTYEKKYLLAANQSYYYLQSLDVQVCRYLKDKFGFKGDDLKYAAYLLVTYAIEVRADDLYPRYQAVLSDNNSPVNVRSIIAEEENHLAEMRHQLKEFSKDWETLCDDVVKLEQALHDQWVIALKRELNLN
jgi:bacterioferritin (cytochrome b1)